MMHPRMRGGSFARTTHMRENPRGQPVVTLSNLGQIGDISTYILSLRFNSTE